MGRRRYSDSDKAAALAALDANDGNTHKTAKQLNIPRTTLERWVEGRVSDDVPHLRQHKKRELHESLEELAYKLVAVMPEKIDEANLQQSAVALGVVIEKMQLLRGDPTERLEHTLTDAERVSRINTLLDAARARRDGRTADDSEYVQ